MDQYLDSRRETIFKQVHTLIYIFDIVSTSPTDMVYFLDILGALRAGSGPSGSASSGAGAGPDSPSDSLASPATPVTPLSATSTSSTSTSNYGSGHGTGSTSSGPMVHVLVSSRHAVLSCPAWPD